MGSDEEASASTAPGFGDVFLATRSNVTRKVRGSLAAQAHDVKIHAREIIHVPTFEGLSLSLRLQAGAAEFFEIGEAAGTSRPEGETPERRHHRDGARFL
jgi:hypothetical protein